MPEKNIYEQLAETLGRLPNGFPRTESGVDIAILRKIYDPEEANLAIHLSGEMTPLDEVARRADASVKATRRLLMSMSRRDLVWFEKKEGHPWFRLAPFVVGAYEGSLERMDHEMGHLFEQYLLEGGMEGLMRARPALHRVLPATGALPEKAEWILPYDDVRAILSRAGAIRSGPCICRRQREQVGHGCDHPRGLCMSFSPRKPAPSDLEALSVEQALDLLEQAEEAGLVHSVSNVREGIGYLCNCCGCCCTLLRGINEWGIEQSVAHANYCIRLDAEACAGCGLCVDRCQTRALAVEGATLALNHNRCIGCGLCVGACPKHALALERKPDSEIVAPPYDMADWEAQRLEK